MRIADKAIERKKEITFPGVVIAEGQTFGKQVEMTSEKVKKRCKVISRSEEGSMQLGPTEKVEKQQRFTETGKGRE